MNPFQFDIRNLPAEGKHLAGHLPPSFFQLPETDFLKAISPLEYDVTVLRDGKDVVVSGQVGATFELQCGRCLESFQQKVEMPDYQAEMPVEKETTMDLTDLIREDILLALPNFPRCEDGNVEPRACPAEGKFDPAELAAEADGEPGGDRGVWDALDKLK
jgi:uncharacterized metal-binding protein YceD (DUF177 family)